MDGWNRWQVDGWRRVDGQETVEREDQEEVYFQPVPSPTPTIPPAARKREEKKKSCQNNTFQHPTYMYPILSCLCTLKYCVLSLFPSFSLSLSVKEHVSFIHSLIHSFTRSFTHSLIHSLVHSFTCKWLIDRLIHQFFHSSTFDSPASYGGYMVIYFYYPEYTDRSISSSISPHYGMREVTTRYISMVDSISESPDRR